MNSALQYFNEQGTARQARIKNNLVLRSKAVGAIRQFFEQSGFIEVDTPIRLAAPAPESHIDVVESGSQYLQASPELHMKRLLCAGYEKIFQICKCFRQKERGPLHIPEFTMLEWYVAGADYRFLMEQASDMIRFAVTRVFGRNKVRFNGTEIDLSGKWNKIRVEEAFARFSDMDMQHALEKGLFDEKLAFDIEPALDRKHPVFLCDYPIEHTPLSRESDSRPWEAQRFELYLAGIEICNGYTELTDPEIQRRRLAEAHAARKGSNRPVYPMPERFLADMTAMPEAAGCALGLDRLVMILADAQSIDEVVAFVPEDDFSVDL